MSINMIEYPSNCPSAACRPFFSSQKALTCEKKKLQLGGISLRSKRNQVMKGKFTNQIVDDPWRNLMKLETYPKARVFKTWSPWRLCDLEAAPVAWPGSHCPFLDGQIPFTKALDKKWWTGIGVELLHTKNIYKRKNNMVGKSAIRRISCRCKAWAPRGRCIARKDARMRAE